MSKNFTVLTFSIILLLSAILSILQQGRLMITLDSVKTSEMCQKVYRPNIISPNKVQSTLSERTLSVVSGQLYLRPP